MRPRTDFNTKVSEAINIVEKRQHFHLVVDGGDKRSHVMYENARCPQVFGQLLADILVDTQTKIKPLTAEVQVAILVAALTKEEKGSTALALRNYDRVIGLSHMDARLLPNRDSLETFLNTNKYTIGDITVYIAESGEEQTMEVLMKAGKEVPIADTLYFQIESQVIRAEKLGRSIDDGIKKALVLTVYKNMKREKIDITADILYLYNERQSAPTKPSNAIGPIIQGSYAMEQFKATLLNSLPTVLPVAPHRTLVPAPATDSTVATTTNNMPSGQSGSTGAPNGHGVAHGQGRSNTYMVPALGNMVLAGNIPGGGGGVPIDIMLVANNAYQAGELARVEKERKDKERKERLVYERQRKEKKAEFKRQKEEKEAEFKREQERLKLLAEEKRKDEAQKAEQNWKTTAQIFDGMGKLGAKQDEMLVEVKKLTTAKKPPKPDAVKPHVTPKKLFVDDDDAGKENRRSSRNAKDAGKSGSDDDDAGREALLEVLISQRSSKNAANEGGFKAKAGETLTMMTEDGTEVPVVVVGTTANRIYYVRDDHEVPQTFSAKTVKFKHPDKGFFERR